MSRPILKTLTFALCAGLIAVGGALPASAFEIQYDYCKDYTTDSEQHAICQAALAELQPIKRENLIDALKVAVASVEQHFPKFDALKEVPYAITMVEAGNPCGDMLAPETNPWNMFCGPWGMKSILAQNLANIDSTDLEVVTKDPAYQTMISKTFKELIDLGKADSKYASDNDFHTLVDTAEQNYNVGMTLLRQALLYFNSSANVDSMTAAELIAAIQALPEYNTYSLKNPADDDPEAETGKYYNGLYWSYADTKATIAYYKGTSDDYDAGEFGVYNEETIRYIRLMIAAKSVDPNFQVVLAGLPTDAAPSKTAPAAPNTGSTTAERSAMIVSVALGGIAAFAGIVGMFKLCRLYFFSPLKRRK